ncbi:MAG: FAD-dependent oxidoreductase [Candidatus Dormibacteraeota bacterium]|nr:FAD-dependent oxidoreductase [Candidatus Dormibacteraeota bacterium]
MADARRFDIVIVGAGPAGLTAALYAGRNMEHAVLLESKAPGGQLLNTELIEDYPGVKSILGVDLAQVMMDQATGFGTELVSAEVEQILVHDDGLKTVRTSVGDIVAPAVILTAGGNPRKLEVPGEVELAGRGVSYCAVCDGAFFRDAELAVVGGGDAAVEEGIFLTRYASKVTIIHRREHFRAQGLLVDEARHNPKIEFLLDNVVDSIDGDDLVKSVSVRNVQTGEKGTVDVGGVFIFVGFLPNTGLVDVHIDHDEAGYYLTHPMTMMTSVPGIFAAGDVRSQLTRQISTAVGDATTATIAAAKWVEEWKRGRIEGDADLVEDVVEDRE